MTLSQDDIGRRFTGPSKPLTDAHFLAYSALSGDTHPIHYDMEYAQTTHFKAPVAHGLLLSGLMALGASDGQKALDGFAMIEQGCRFLKAVKVGDTVQPIFEIERLWESNSKTFCRVKTFLLKHDGEAVAEGFHLYRILKLTDVVEGKNG